MLKQPSDTVSIVYMIMCQELDKTHPYFSAADATFDSIRLLISSAHPSSSKPLQTMRESRHMAREWLSNPGAGARILLTKAIFDSCVTNVTNALADDNKFQFIICAIVETTHNLSLIVDDCIDCDLIRRNKPTIFGVGGPAAVLAVSRVLIDLIFRLIWTLSCSSSIKKNCVSLVVAHAHRIANSIHQEIRWDIEKEWRLDSSQVNEVREIYAVKSVGVVEMGVDLMKCLTSLDDKNADWFVAYTKRVGIFLQLVNDIENFSTVKSCGARNLDRFSDIRKRRLTLLLLQESQSGNQLTKQLIQAAFSHNRADTISIETAKHLIKTGAVLREINRLTELKRMLEEHLNNNTFLHSDFKLLILKALNHYFSKLTNYQFSLEKS